MATREIYTIQRPSALPAAVCPPLPAVPPYAPVVVPTALRAQLPQVHQVQIQSELAHDLVPTNGGGNGTTVFRGSEGVKAAKPAAIWMTDARGVPPRGRPV